MVWGLAGAPEEDLSLYLPPPSLPTKDPLMYI